MLVDRTDPMDGMSQETVVPVLPIRVVDDLDEALALANDAEFGLTSSVFTQNLNAAMKAARGLRFGETNVNREYFEAMPGSHAGRRKSGVGGEALCQHRHIAGTEPRRHQPQPQPQPRGGEAVQRCTGRDDRPARAQHLG